MAADAGASDLGRYRLGRLLGRGGMGEVYLAHDETLDRDVAIKFVSADKVGDEVASRRLLHEALSAAALDHPCICTVYETGHTPEGQAFIVMQYVEGQPLSTLLAGGTAARAGRPEHRGQHRRGLGRRAPARHHPSRPEAVQRDGHALRASEAAGFRHRQTGRAAAVGRERADVVGGLHDGRHDRRDAGLHVARADPAAPARRAQRPVLARRAAV